MRLVSISKGQIWTQIHTGRMHVKMQAETRVMLLQHRKAKEGRQSPKS